MYGSRMTPCNDCGSCVIRGDGRCIIEDDDMNKYLDKLAAADGIILAAPAYFDGVPGQMKLLFERMGIAASNRTQGNKLAHKVGCAIAVQGHDGGINAYMQMVNFMLRNRMIVCGSSPLSVLTGSKQGEVLNDKAGIEGLKELGKEIGWLISKMRP
jgi:multimeric flavodoxin WrbA